MATSLAFSGGPIQVLRFLAPGFQSQQILYKNIVTADFYCQEHFAQQHPKGAYQRNHGKDEQGTNQPCDIDGDKNAQKGTCHQDANEQRADDGQYDRMVDQADASRQQLQFVDIRVIGLFILRDRMVQAILNDAAAVDDSSQAIVQCRQNSADGSQQKHRRHRELNNAGNVGYMFHVARCRLASVGTFTA